MLQPMTPDEYRKAVEQKTGKILSEEELMNPKCVVSGSTCISQGCKQMNGKCEMDFWIDGFYCICGDY